MISRTIFFVMMLSLIATKALAEGIAIEPGKWEMTTTFNMAMLTQPRVTTTTECMEESEISPENMTDEMDSGCTYEARVVEGNTMKWSMNCEAETGSSRGEWEATSHGDTLTGSGKIEVEVQGQAMEMLMSWEGRHVGDCD